MTKKLVVRRITTGDQELLVSGSRQQTGAKVISVYDLRSGQRLFSGLIVIPERAIPAVIEALQVKQDEEPEA